MADERATYPGPKARAIIERMRQVEGAGPRTGAGEPLVVDHATGATLVDPDGNRFTDLAGSFAAATIGHSHPDVVAAVAAQIGVASHVSTAAVSEQRVAFEEDLLAIVPREPRSRAARDQRRRCERHRRPARAEPDRPPGGTRVLGRLLRAGRRGRRIERQVGVSLEGRHRRRCPFPPLPRPVSLAGHVRGLERDWRGRSRPRAPGAGGPGVGDRAARGDHRRADPGQRRDRPTARRIPRRACEPSRTRTGSP